MEATAERHHSLISAVLLGAICGSGVLPFTQAGLCGGDHAAAALAVKTNLAAFEEACQQASSGGTAVHAATGGGVRRRCRHRRVPRTCSRCWSACAGYPLAVQPLVFEGVRRTLDYQDPRYAQLYLERVEGIAQLEPGAAAGGPAALTEATARGLALWMTLRGHDPRGASSRPAPRASRACARRFAPRPGSCSGLRSS